MSWGTHSPADADWCERPHISKVLIVDDNVDSREMFALVLEMAGHTVCTATDGAEALALAATFEPDVIFMDIEMPQADGYMTCQNLRKMTGLQETRIYAASGVTGAAHERRCSEVGFDGQISKPADPDYFARFV